VILIPEMQTVGRSLISACHQRKGAEWNHDAQSGYAGYYSKSDLHSAPVLSKS